MSRSFQGAGRWLGAAEVYDDTGRFAGNGKDTRHVQRDVEPGITEVEVSFEGPFSMGGRYRIADRGDHRLYQGPVNVGFAEAYSDDLVDANAYWADPGLTQRFFLMLLPGGDRQLSLSLMSRGEQLQWVVVGEYARQPDEGDGDPWRPFVTDDPADLATDPTAGRGELLLHRSGAWTGELTVLDADLAPTGTTAYVETVEANRQVERSVSGTGYSEDVTVAVDTDGWAAWSGPGAVVGSYSLSGGRALAGTLVHTDEELRCWQREVAAHDGSVKAVVHAWFRGGRRLGVVHGVLTFDPA